jgi:hypothetical protein
MEFKTIVWFRDEFARWLETAKKQWWKEVSWAMTLFDSQERDAWWNIKTIFSKQLYK